MRFVALDGEYVVATKNHGKQTIAANTLEVPELESQNEATEYFGGEAGVLDALNDGIRSRAKNGAIAIIRNGAADAKFNVLLEKAITYAKTFTWERDRGASKKAILEGVDSLRELKASGELENMSQEQLLALLQSSLKL